MKCVGGDAKGLYTPDYLHCKALDSTGGDDISWACTASLPPYFKLGATDVLCEGYNYPDDPYILRGSCGVEYRLMLTDAGYKKYGDRGFGRRGAKAAAWIFWLLFFGVVGVIIWGAWNSGTGQAGRRVGEYGGGGGPWFWGGGGGGGPGDGPPPPYDPRPPRPWGKSAGQGGWQPGFWSGMAAGAVGAAAGNAMFGGRSREREVDRERSSWWNTSSSRGPLYGSSSYNFGSSGGGGESSAMGGARYESTGFGQTRRR